MLRCRWQEETLPKDRGSEDQRHHDPDPSGKAPQPLFGFGFFDWLGQFSIAAPAKVFIVGVPGVAFDAGHCGLSGFTSKRITYFCESLYPNGIEKPSNRVG